MAGLVARCRLPGSGAPRRVLKGVSASIDVVLRLVLLLAAGVTFIVLAVASADFFRRPAAGSGRRMQLHQTVAIVIGLTHAGALLASRDLDRYRMIVATVLYLAGLGLFLWAQDAVKRRPPLATFAESPPDCLVEGGPYCFVRHPLYTAYTAVWFAGVVATANLWLMASALWMALRYAVAAAEEELGYEQTPFAGQYRRYRARTGMFLPKVWRARPHAHEPGLIDRRVVVLVVLASVALSAWLIFEALGRGNGTFADWGSQ